MTIDISKYKVVGGEPFLRCFVELDDATEAYCIKDDMMMVKSAMLNLVSVV